MVKVYGIKIGLVEGLSADTLCEMSYEQRRRLVSKYHLDKDDDHVYSLEQFFFLVNIDQFDLDDYYYFIA